MTFTILDPAGALGERSLSILATILHRSPAQVRLCSRAQHVATIVCKPRVIVVDPQRCTMLGVLLAAQLLGRRREVRSRRWRYLAPRPVPVTWQQDARRALEQRHPVLATLPMIFWRVALDGEPPQIAWRDARMRELSDDEILDAASGAVGELELDRDLSCGDGASDLARIVDAVVSGRAQRETLPEFEDVPFVRVPLRIASIATEPERYDALAAEYDVGAGAVRSLVRCLRRGSEGRAEAILAQPPSHVGVQLDLDRVPDVVAARRAGRELPAFVEPDVVLSEFDPARMPTVILLDPCAFRSGDLAEPSANFGAMLPIVRAIETLGMPAAVHVATDRVVRDHEGRDVHLHFHGALKTFDEPFSPAFWDRMSCLPSFDEVLPGEAGMFAPLHAESVVASVRAATARTTDLASIYCLWIGSFVLGATGRVAPIPARAAGAVDFMVDRAQRDSGVSWGGGVLMPIPVERALHSSGTMARLCVRRRAER
jgi:hypothetical protein